MKGTKMDKDRIVSAESELTDIRDIRINPALSKEERLEDFIRQITDP